MFCRFGLSETGSWHCDAISIINIVCYSTFDIMLLVSLVSEGISTVASIPHEIEYRRLPRFALLPQVGWVARVWSSHRVLLQAMHSLEPSL